MSKGLLPTHSLFFVNFEASGDKIFGMIACALDETNSLIINGVNQLNLIVCWPWGSSMQHFIVNQSDAP